jgi:putative cardiolipin synthase
MFGEYGRSFGRLHAKCAVIDKEIVFVGSMNFDPRSDKINTEMGLFIHSTELAAELLRLLEIVKTDGSYQLRLASDGSQRIEWVVRQPEGERILSSEPEATPWRQLLLDLVTPLAPEELL